MAAKGVRQTYHLHKEDPEGCEEVLIYVKIWDTKSRTEVPVDGDFVGGCEDIVALREMPRSEKSFVGRERRWVGGFQHIVSKYCRLFTYFC